MGIPREVSSQADVAECDECEGTIISANENKYVRKLKDGKGGGQGTLIFADGRIPYGN